MAVSVNIAPDGASATIRFTGSLSHDQWMEVRRECSAVQCKGQVTFDLSGLEELDNAGVGILVHLSQRLKKAGHEIVLTDCRPEIRQRLGCNECRRWFRLPPSKEADCPRA